MFQSTRPRGARPHELAAVIDKQVSIHAPAGGATRLKTNNDNGGCVSIHAPAGGATASAECGEEKPWFQSTRPRGARLGCVAREVQTTVSIHAPAGGATTFRLSPKGDIGFQSTRPRGARHKCYDLVKFSAVSIHAPAGGATWAEFF